MHIIIDRGGNTTPNHRLNSLQKKRFKFKIQNSCEGIKSGLVPAQPLSDLASPIDDPGCSINSEECCTAGP